MGTTAADGDGGMSAPTTAGLAATAGEGPAAGPALSFIAHGQPKPKGSLRHVGHGRLIEQVDGKVWRESIIWAVVSAMPSPGPFTGPIHVEAVFTVRKPISAPKRRRTWPITRSSGDLDKHLRQLCDALQAAGAVTDDSQIVSVAASKVYPLEGPDALNFPGVVVRVHRVGEA